MRNVINVNPLILNYMKPENPKEFSAEEMTVIYDPKTQTTMFMGGGGGSASRSYDGYKGTKQRSGGGYETHNDAERWTDD